MRMLLHSNGHLQVSTVADRLSMFATCGRIPWEAPTLVRNLDWNLAAVREVNGMCSYLCCKMEILRLFFLWNSQNNSGNNECCSLSVGIDAWQQISLKRDAVALGYFRSRYKRLSSCYFGPGPNARITLRPLFYRPGGGSGVYAPRFTCVALREVDRVIVRVDSYYC
jgi:hypothetical protein